MAEETTELVEQLLPDDAAALTAAEEEAQLADPSVIDSAPLIVEEDLPPAVGKSYAFDFVSGRFIPTSTGGAQPTFGLTTLRFWIEKCLRTPRGSCPIHDDDYGLEGADDIIGRQFDAGMVADLGQRIERALTYHPHINAVRGFTYEHDPDDETLWISFTAETDQGDTLDFQDFPL